MEIGLTEGLLKNIYFSKKNLELKEEAHVKRSFFSKKKWFFR